MQTRPTFPVLAVLPRLSCSAFHTTVVLSQLFCPSCPCCHALAIPFSLSCPGWPIQADLFYGPVVTYQSRLSCPWCPASYIPSWLPLHGSLSPLSCPSYPVLAVMFWPCCNLGLFRLNFYEDMSRVTCLDYPFLYVFWRTSGPFFTIFSSVAPHRSQAAAKCNPRWQPIRRWAISCGLGRRRIRTQDCRTTVWRTTIEPSFPICPVLAIFRFSWNWSIGPQNQEFKTNKINK